MRENVPFTPGRIVGIVLRYLVATVSLSIVFYIIFALFISTPEERKLEKENALYEQLYGQMVEREALVGDVVDGLLVKDNDIYRQLFETDAPKLNPLTAVDLLSDSDSLSDSFYQTHSAVKSENLMRMADRVDETFREIFDLLVDRDTLPPISLPLKQMSYAQTGASIGLKHNPIYKVEMQHDGLDLIAPQGEKVFATAPGTVSDVSRSHRGLGHVVEIDHLNGYKTRYALLGDVMVTKGQKVHYGQLVGYIGEPGMFAPHLHFEVLRDGQVLDPVNHLFASITPEEYARMLYMAGSTLQALD